ncbi:hypothetical protein PL75_01060 [Neisseria arctica]|uniref:Uncharacterized protein n=1 Tax=Neisseria arctica TaxID=1470200 RepID=A0A0J0YTZ8_9NEIS|nr:hypothetical protein [Neisseria arctica]KLT73575.1 hypothetical protein PL75_01060 [Neisseria arctica]UOO85690.1 hypothetical protein LVJ86_05470 [Neisseria arctica]
MTTFRDTYNKYSDPGHGWLEVPIAELHALGIYKQISGYSYRNGQFAYLEEDCDLHLFRVAKQEQQGIAIKYIQHFSDVLPIRHYCSFH